jgi:hypothetical protein
MNSDDLRLQNYYPAALIPYINTNEELDKDFGRAEVPYEPPCKCCSQREAEVFRVRPALQTMRMRLKGLREVFKLLVNDEGRRAYAHHRHSNRGPEGCVINM